MHSIRLMNELTVFGYKIARLFAAARGKIALCLLTFTFISAAVQGQTVLPVQWMYSPIAFGFASAYSPDGSKLVVGGLGGMQIYDAATGAFINSLPTAANFYTYSVAFSPDGSMLAIGGQQNNNATGSWNFAVLEVWSMQSGKLLASYAAGADANAAIASVAFSPDGKTLAAGGSIYDSSSQTSSGLLEEWSVTSGKLLALLKTGATSGVASVAFSPNGAYLVDGGLDSTGIVEVWNPLTYQRVAKLATAADSVCAVAVSPDGTTLGVGGDSYTVSGAFTTYTGVLELWNLSTLKLSNSLPTSATFIYALSFSPSEMLADGGALYDPDTNSNQGVIEWWNSTTGRQTESLATAATEVHAIAFSPNGKSMADFGANYNLNASSEIPVLEQWAVAGGTLASSINTKAVGSGQACAIAPKSPYIAMGATIYPLSGGPTGIVTVWNFATGGLVESLPSSANYSIWSVAFSPDSGTIVDGGQATSTGPGVLEVWNVASGKLAGTLPTSATSEVDSVGFSSDGSILFDGGLNPSGGVVELWNASSLSLRTSFPTAVTQGVSSVALSTDGKTLADAGVVATSAGSSNVVELWNVTGKKLLKSLSSSTAFIWQVAFSPNGQVLADCGPAPQSGFSSPPIVEIWDVSTGLLITKPTLASGTGYVYSVCFTPDGTVLFVASDVGLQAFSTKDYSLLADAGPKLFSLGMGGAGAFLDYISVGPAVSPNPYFGYTLNLKSLSMDPSSVPSGDSSTGTITLASEAPFGGVSIPLKSSNAAVVVPSTVVVPAGETSATFRATTGNVSTPTTATITAGTGSTAVTASLTVELVDLSSVVVSPSSVGGGLTATGTVSLSGAAGPSGTVVSLSSTSTSAIVPGSVIVAAGSSSATFTVTTQAVSSSVTTTITASLRSQQVTATLSVNPAVLTMLSVSPSSFVGGLSSSGTVALSGLAASALTISLSSDKSTVKVPSSVVVAAGRGSASFPITSSAVSSSQPVTITASSGSVSKTAMLVVDAASLVSISVSPTSVVGGKTAAGTLSLNGPAAKAVTIELSSSSKSATVPSSVSIAAGKSSGTFTVHTSPVPSTLAVTLTATAGSGPLSAPLTIQPPTVKSLTLSPTSVVGGKSSTGKVTLTSVAPTGGLVISLSSSGSAATVPASVKIPGGATSATFTVKTSKVSSTVQVAISGSLNSAVTTAALTIT